MTANAPDDFPRSPFAAGIYEEIRGSVRSPGPLPANPAAAAELERAVSEVSR